MKSWQTRLGLAFAAAGTMMVGGGILVNLSGVPSRLLLVVAGLGFGFQVIGKFLTVLFTPDSAQFANLKATVATHAAMLRSQPPTKP